MPVVCTGFADRADSTDDLTSSRLIIQRSRSPPAGVPFPQGLPRIPCTGGCRHCGVSCSDGQERRSLLHVQQRREILPSEQAGISRLSRQSLSLPSKLSNRETGVRSPTGHIRQASLSASASAPQSIQQGRCGSIPQNGHIDFAFRVSIGIYFCPRSAPKIGPPLGVSISRWLWS